MIGDMAAVNLGTRGNVDACTKFQVVDIVELYNGECTHAAAQTCVATINLECEYINNDGDVTYQWYTDIGTITNGDTARQVLILVTADTDTEIEVTCEIEDGIGQLSDLSKYFITIHSEV